MSYHFDFAKACEGMIPAQEFFNKGTNAPSPQFEEDCRYISVIAAQEDAVLTKYMKSAIELKETALSLSVDDIRLEKVLNSIDSVKNRFNNDIEMYYGGGGGRRNGQHVHHAANLWSESFGELGERCFAVADDVKHGRTNETVMAAYKETLAKCNTYAQRYGELMATCDTELASMKPMLNDGTHNVKAVKEAYKFLKYVRNTIEYGIMCLTEITGKRPKEVASKPEDIGKSAPAVEANLLNMNRIGGNEE